MLHLIRLFICNFSTVSKSSNPQAIGADVHSNTFEFCLRLKYVLIQSDVDLFFSFVLFTDNIGSRSLLWIRVKIILKKRKHPAKSKQNNGTNFKP